MESDVNRFFNELDQLLRSAASVGQNYETRYVNCLARNALFTAIADFLGLGGGDNPSSQPQRIERWYQMDRPHHAWQIASWDEVVRRIETSNHAPALRREAFLKECVGDPSDPNPDYADTVKHVFKTVVRDLTQWGADPAAFDDAAFTRAWGLCGNFIDNIWKMPDDGGEGVLINSATHAPVRGRMVVIEYGDDGYPSGAQFPHARAFPSLAAATFYYRFIRAYYAHVLERYNEFGAAVVQLHLAAETSLPSRQYDREAAERLLTVFAWMYDDEDAVNEDAVNEDALNDWFGAFIALYGQEHGMNPVALTNMMRGRRPMAINVQTCQRGVFMAMNGSVSPRISMALFNRMSRAAQFRRDWRPMRLVPLAQAEQPPALLPPDIKIAQTTQEYMSMCRTSTKTADECMRAECPACLEKFMRRGALFRPVMFHKTGNSRTEEIWSCPVHPEEQVRWGNRCMGCRKQLDLTPAQLEAVVTRYASPRIITAARDRVSKQNRSAFNAAFPRPQPPTPPSRPKKSRSNNKSRSAKSLSAKSLTRSKTLSAKSLSQTRSANF